MAAWAVARPQAHVTLTVRPATAADTPHLTAIARAAKASWGYPVAWLRAWNAELAITPSTIAMAHGFVAEPAPMPGAPERTLPVLEWDTTPPGRVAPGGH